MGTASYRRYSKVQTSLNLPFQPGGGLKSPCARGAASAFRQDPKPGVHGETCSAEDKPEPRSV